MSFYRFTSWLYVIVVSGIVPAAILDFSQGRIALTPVWVTLLVLSLPLLLAQLLGFRRVLHEQASLYQADSLIT